METKLPGAESGQAGVTVAYVAVGSNLGEREKTLESAVRAIGELPGSRVLARSTWVRTKPVGIEDQPEFLNGAMEIETSLAPRRLMDELLRIEFEHGRRRVPNERMGPRTLDLDLLLYGTRIVEEEGLSVPHPRMGERVFVLAPLAEIASHAMIPTLGVTVGEALDRLVGSGA